MLRQVDQRILSFGRPVICLLGTKGRMRKKFNYPNCYAEYFISYSIEVISYKVPQKVWK